MALHCSGSRPAKCAVNEREDRLSRLPDCILISILSLLPLKQAGAMSVVSQFWRQLWASIYQKLDFDFPRFDQEPGLTPKDFVESVNKALASYKWREVHEFRIRCGLDRSFEKDVDEWLNYVFARQVKRLELDLSSASGFDRPCRFPGGLLKLPGSLGIPGWLLENLGERQGSFDLLDHRNLGFLTSLSLSGLNVTSFILGHIMTSFHFLETLKVRGSKVLSKCVVWSGARALQHLEITDCTGLEYLNLSYAQCLVSLKVTNVPRLAMGNVPNLVNVSLPGFSWDIDRIIPLISTIEVLTFEVYYTDLKEVTEFSQLSKLKQFNLTVMDLPVTTPAHLISLMSSLPELEKLVLKLLWTRDGRKPRDLRAAMLFNLDSYAPWAEQEAKKYAEKLKGALPASVEFSIV